MCQIWRSIYFLFMWILHVTGIISGQECTCFVYLLPLCTFIKNELLLQLTCQLFSGLAILLQESTCLPIFMPIPYVPWLLCFKNRSWNQKVYAFNLVLFEFFWLFHVFCTLICISKSVKFYKKTCSCFHWDCLLSGGDTWHLNNSKLFSSWIQYRLPFIKVFFNFYQQKYCCFHCACRSHLLSDLSLFHVFAINILIKYDIFISVSNCLLPVY